jgi:hypothetical protein
MGCLGRIHFAQDIEKFWALVYTVTNVPEGKYHFQDLGVDESTFKNDSETGWGAWIGFIPLRIWRNFGLLCTR